jgi:hypothetical protein
MIRNEERTGLVLTVAGGAGLLLLLLWMLGFFQKPELPAPAAVHASPRRSGSVAGEIVDAKSGRAVEGPAIEISGLDGVSDHWLAPADPAEPSRFELKGVPAERDFVLEVDAPGYVGVRRPTRVAAGATVDAGTIRLVPLATISGTVVDANYEALANAEVVAERVDPGEAATPSTHGDPTAPEIAKSVRGHADARGSFRLEGLAPARWSLSALTTTGERTAGSTFVDASLGGATEPIELEAFPLDAGALPELAKGWRPPGPEGGPRELVVRVVDEAGRPLAGASVLIKNGDSYSQSRFTARNGQATFRGIPDQYAGLSFVVAELGSRMSFNERAIPTALKGSGAPFELRCLPTCSLAVKVIAPDGNPVEHARVGVRVPTTEPPMGEARGPRSLPKAPSTRYASTDASGVTRFELLPPPPWTISIDDTDFEPWSTTEAKPDADDTVTVQLVKKKSDG